MLRFVPTALALLLSVFAIGARVARAQPVSSRILEGIASERIESDVALRIRFAVPIFYLRHAPLEQGDSLNIQLKPLAVPRTGERVIPQRESIQVPRDFPMPVQSVTLEVEGASNPVVEVRFSRFVRYSVEQGDDLRSVIVRVPAVDVRGLSRAPEPRLPPPPSLEMPTAPVAPADAEDAPMRAELMREGRRALTAEDYERASALFTKLLSLPEGSDSPQALELLALARERKGQLAHAKAEYEQYLERYPSDPGAERVRQRLEALVTAREEPPPRRPAPTRRPERRRLALESFGSLYVGYRYDGRQTDDFGDETLDSSLFTDVHMENRLDFDSWSLRNQVTGGYRHGFLDGGEDETRVSSLFFEAEALDGRLVSSVGRRRKSNGGVLGRYDGAEVTFRVGELWSIGAVGGLPVDSSTDGFEGFDRYFGGINGEVGPLFGVLDIELFAIAQAEGSFVDRAAVGAEVRYFDVGRSVSAFLDFDVYYQVLNTAQVVASWQPTDSTYLTLFGDYRTVPTLTTRNALQGQGVVDLGDLEDLFSRDEIEKIARDRTARSANLSLSASQILTDRFQLAFDVGASHLSDTPEAGGLETLEGTGFEFSYSAQFIANDIVTAGDVGVVGLRYFDGGNTDILSGTLSARYPLTRDLRLTPRFRADYRMQDGPDMVTLQPSLRFDVSLWVLRFDAEVGADWDLGGLQDGLSYFSSIGVRYDF